MRPLVVAAFLLWSLPASAVAQDLLNPVRELYAAADYEGALAALNLVHEAPSDLSIVRETAHYRVLCLVALDRLPEAEEAIETILNKDPLYQLSADEAPPRVRGAFEQVRQRVAPIVARQLYEAGKEAFDRKAFKEALDLLDRVLRIVDDPATATAPGLSDYKVLAAGFRDLSRASLPPDAREVPPAPELVGKATTAPTASRTEPVVIRQPLPPWPGASAGAFFDRAFTGAIEIEIDETGRVTAARMTQPVHPAYDDRLLAMARTWLYEPARVGGIAVQTTKRIDIQLRPR